MPRSRPTGWPGPRANCDQASADDSQSPAPRLTVLVADVLAVLTGAIHVATRRPRWS